MMTPNEQINIFLSVIEDYRGEIARLRQINKELAEEHEELWKEAEDYRLENISLLKDNDLFTMQVAEMTLEIESLENEVDVLKMENHNLELENDELARDLDAAQDRITQWENGEL